MEKEKIMIRNPQESDKEKVRELLAQHNFEFPSGPIVTHAIVEKDGRVLGYGMVRLIAEEVLIMDKEIGIRDKAKTLELLHYKAISASFEKGYEQLHAFVQDEHFIEVLKKHYGYVVCKGKAIVMDF